MNAITNTDQFRQALTQFEGQIVGVAQQLSMGLPSHISIDKFQRTLMAAVKADPELLRADRRSLLNACEKAALDGLLPDKREAALVVFKRNYKDAQGAWQQALEVVYMPMVYGLRKKILQSDEITDITAKVVYRCEVENGAFIYEEGTNAMLRHRPMLEMTEEQAGDENIVAAYSMATYRDGSKSYEVMRRFEIDKVRECSQTGATKDRYGKPRKPFGPWVDWFPEQAKKTAMRRHSKTLPMSSDLVDVEGRELDSARSVEAMLSVPADEPVSLPSHNEGAEGQIADQSGTESGVQFDADTGEVVTDPRGMTQVDEKTAQRLDAGQAQAEEEPGQAEEQGEADEAETGAEGGAPPFEPTYRSMMRPGNPEHGDSWWCPDRRLMRWAHKVGKNGMEWRNEPPEGFEPDTGQGEAATPVGHEQGNRGEPTKAQTKPSDPHEGQLYAEHRSNILGLLSRTETPKDVKTAESEFMRFFVSFPEPVQREIEDALAVARDRISNP